MKKTILLLLAAATLAGCSDPVIEYKGEKRPMSEVSEIIGDELEAENPGLDIDVDVYEEPEE